MILALESSCDETALAVFDAEVGMRREWIYSQIDLHGEYGGVVPDLASREHARRFAPMLHKVWAEHDPGELSLIAVTEGPGLAACLAVGIATAEALGLALRLPVMGVNHLNGHVWSPFVQLHADDPRSFHLRMQAHLPHLGLLVSGGNTLLFAIGKDMKIRVLARTVDDAAGEALDKGAKLLGMGYPGGPRVERTAHTGDARKHNFPGGLMDPSDMRFSFSGLKTSLRYRMEKMSDTELAAELPDLCAGYQAAVISQLLLKTTHALKQGTFRSIGLSGGVANNRTLRQALSDLAEAQHMPLFTPEMKHSGDNAGMIAFAAWVESLASGWLPSPPKLNPSLSL